MLRLGKQELCTAAGMPMQPGNLHASSLASCCMENGGEQQGAQTHSALTECRSQDDPALTHVDYLHACRPLSLASAKAVSQQ